MLPVNEIFETIQGEGFHTGRPAVFIRLQGCPVGCPWCDTKHTWETDAALMAESMGAILAKTESSPTWSPAMEEAIFTIASRYRAHHVVITGGEPCLYDLRALSKCLLDDGRSVQVETSGTHRIMIDHRAWVTVSPKVNMPNGLGVRSDALARADEIKMPIGKMEDINNLLALLSRDAHQQDVAIYLQPISLSKRATEICTANAIANNWRVSVQTHVLAGLR